MSSFSDMVAATWSSVWQMPLHVDRECPTYAYSANGVMALTFIDDDEDMMRRFVRVVNGMEDGLPGVWTAEGCEIYRDGDLVCYVRGWGHLTGVGGLRLPRDMAATIQDGFVEFIIGRLNGSKC